MQLEGLDKDTWFNKVGINHSQRVKEASEASKKREGKWPRNKIDLHAYVDRLPTCALAILAKYYLRGTVPLWFPCACRSDRPLFMRIASEHVKIILFFLLTFVSLS